MTNYREILRLSSLGTNNSQITESMGIARQTVITTLQRAAGQGLDWQTAEPLSDKELAARLFPQGEGKHHGNIGAKALLHAAAHILL